eukprot:755468-Pelagomonas_calceolata.AAC.1
MLDENVSSATNQPVGRATTGQSQPHNRLNELAADSRCSTLWVGQHQLSCPRRQVRQPLWACSFQPPIIAKHTSAQAHKLVKP